MVDSMQFQLMTLLLLYHLKIEEAMQCPRSSPQRHLLVLVPSSLGSSLLPAILRTD